MLMKIHWQIVVVVGDGGGSSWCCCFCLLLLSSLWSRAIFAAFAQNHFSHTHNNIIKIASHWRMEKETPYFILLSHMNIVNNVRYYTCLCTMFGSFVLYCVVFNFSNDRDMTVSPSVHCRTRLSIFFCSSDTSSSLALLQAVSFRWPDQFCSLNINDDRRLFSFIRSHASPIDFMHIPVKIYDCKKKYAAAKTRSEKKIMVWSIEWRLLNLVGIFSV